MVTCLCKTEDIVKIVSGIALNLFLPSRQRQAMTVFPGWHRPWSGEYSQRRVVKYAQQVANDWKRLYTGRPADSAQVLHLQQPGPTKSKVWLNLVIEIARLGDTGDRTP